MLKKERQEEKRSGTYAWPQQPQRLGGNSLTRAHSFTSPARTNESKSKSNSISQFQQVGEAGLAPPKHPMLGSVFYI